MKSLCPRRLLPWSGTLSFSPHEILREILMSLGSVVWIVRLRVAFLRMSPFLPCLLMEDQCESPGAQSQPAAGV